MITYPKLMRSEKHKVIVLFSQPCSGVVVDVFDGANFNLGTEVSLGNMVDFEDYFGVVKLQNEVVSLNELQEAKT